MIYFDPLKFRSEDGSERLLKDYMKRQKRSLEYKETYEDYKKGLRKDNVLLKKKEVVIKRHSDYFDKTEITIINNLGYSIDLVWIKSEKKDIVEKKNMETGTTHTQPTLVGHVWRVDESET